MPVELFFFDSIFCINSFIQFIMLIGFEPRLTSIDGLKNKTLVKHEMGWTILWFQNQANLLSERSKTVDGSLPLGHKSYAIKQQKLWNSFEKKASEIFGIYLR